MAPNIALANPPFAPVPAGLAVIRHLTPPRYVIHVGAGNGVTAGQHWRDLAAERVLLLDANPAQAQHLTAAVAATPGWAAAAILLGTEEAESAAFFVTSNPSANGCLPVEQLRAIWPNLRPIETLWLPKRRLDRFLDTCYPDARAAANWLVIDCFPALPILAGAGHYLDRLDVVCSRTILNPAFLAADGSLLADLSAYLTPRGFRQIAVTEGLHPALGDALFVRDWRSQLADDRQAQITALTRQCDAQTRLADDRQAQITALTQQCDAQTRLADDRQAQLESLKTTIQTEQQRSTQREEQLTQLQFRQRLADEEMIRAEAQIDLIKDLLLRDRGL